MEAPNCFNCGLEISSKYDIFEELREKYEIDKIYEMLHIDNICCRMRFRTIIDSWNLRKLGKYN